MNKLLFIAVMTAIAAPVRAQYNFDSLAVSARDIMRSAAENPVAINPVSPELSKPKIGLVSKGERSEYVTRASLWLPEGSFNTAAMDFKVGPFEKMKYAPEELVTCSYVPMKEAYETGKPNGMSPKFKCRDAKGKDFKVKYGGGEVITEVASSWVLTAIGAYADRMYPVRLNCPDCPSDPFKNEADPGAWQQGQMVAIEDKLGERIETSANSGIGFDEFHRITDKVGAEALAGITHFLSNSDNKAANQAMACQKKNTVVNPATGRVTCNNPVVYLQDMGISFGGRGLYHNSRMNFDKWAKEKIWDDPRACIMHLNSTYTSSLQGVDPIGRDLHQIGEQARQMIIRRLSMLSREQLADIFTAARAPQREPQHSAGEWADLFLNKVEQLRHPQGAKTPPGFACPFQIIPPNSAPQPDNFIN